MTTSATDANGKVTVSGLPLYNGTTAISYTVTEAAAPANYIKSARDGDGDARNRGQLRRFLRLHQRAHGQGCGHQDLL